MIHPSQQTNGLRFLENLAYLVGVAAMSRRGLHKAFIENVGRTPGQELQRVRIERADRGVEVAAAAGLINVIQAGGPVVAETGAGSIKVHSAGNVRCESGAGTIQL